MVTFEPVPRRQHEQAVCFLIDGQPHEEFCELRARAFEQFVRSCGGRMRLWHALGGGQCCAAAAIVQTPGRAGMLFYSPPQARAVDSSALGELVDRLTAACLAEGLSLVQKLLDLGAEQEIALLEGAKYQRLADLVYMRLSPSDGAPEQADPRLTWRSYGQFKAAELAAVIAASYEGSLDCPSLCGVRGMDDVIAAHKATGVFMPRWWWIVSVDGQPAGCALMNRSPAARSCEVVYIGVAKPFRRQGLGRALLRRAIRQAHRGGCLELTLAADVRNRYACSLYEQEGFQAADRRLAYARTALAAAVSNSE